jgi:iron complex transport system substrate-binding protein
MADGHRIGSWALPALGLGLACVLPLLAPSAAPAAPPRAPIHPERIVALGVPADELALALVAPTRIAALDRFADDPGASNVTAQARAVAARVPVSAEAIAALDPDLVLVPAWTGVALDAALHRFGIATLRIGTPTSLRDVRRTIREVARALDAEARGEALITTLDASLARTRARRHATPSVLLDSGSGFSPGAGTLLAELVEVAGGELLFARQGLPGLVPLSLERELALDPDVLLVDAYRADGRARGVIDATRDAHGLDPRLGAMRAVREGRVEPMASRLLLTTTHHVAETAEALFEALHARDPRS